MLSSAHARALPDASNSGNATISLCTSGAGLAPIVSSRPLQLSGLRHGSNSSSSCNGSTSRPHGLHGMSAASPLGHSSRRAGTASHVCHATWLENKGQVTVPAPLDVCWSMWEARERIPQWMPWIKSVKVLEKDPRLSKWTLSTNQFGRDWEFSWLARNLPPVKNQKIHWVSEPGSMSMPGVSVNNRGQIKFVPKPPGGCEVTLIISYEVPDILVPFANLLTPVVEGIIQKDMERFRELAIREAAAKQTPGALPVS